MKKLRVIGIAVTVVGLVHVALLWLPVKMLFNSLITTDIVSESIMADIRDSMTEQDSFNTLVDRHRGGPKRYLYKTPMTVYTTIDLGMYDVYALYVNGGKHWVVRLGVYPDPNAETFFSNQVGGIVGTAWGYSMGLFNYLISVGVLKPILYHVTDDPSTSFISPTYTSVPGLV